MGHNYRLQTGNNIIFTSHHVYTRSMKETHLISSEIASTHVTLTSLVFSTIINKKQAITRERELLSEIAINFYKPSEFSEYLSGKFICRTNVARWRYIGNRHTHKLTTVTLVRMRAER